ncbi:GlxA family transcriptional regulator [Streptomyces halstedii]|uniref:GlxA family transcriptional regulator n=1 Tax=Streptomyces halstedii TaxID=1944 RepID=UPI00380B2E10
MPLPHHVVIAVFPGVDLLDVTGPAEVFALADREAAERGVPGAEFAARSTLDGDTGGGDAVGRAGCYRVRLAGPAAGPVRTSAGVRLVTDVAFEEVDGPIDTLLVPGAAVMSGGVPTVLVDPDVVAWVRAVAPRARRVASLCVGAHLLAAAGLLDGKTATTHWATAAQLAADHPAVTVDPDPIFVRADQGRLWTGAGISSCLDLALALVAEDLGEDIALAVARQLVMYLKRQGGQSQFSVPLSKPAASRRDIDELRLWISDHLDEDLSAEALAGRMCLSERHFARVFKRETGAGPAAYVEAARVEMARRLLETTDCSLDHVTAATGLGSTQTLHRAFKRQYATTPAAHRRRFRRGAAANSGTAGTKKTTGSTGTTGTTGPTGTTGAAGTT